MAAFSDFYESHEPPPSGDACSIVPAHRNGHQNGQQSGHMLHLCFVCCPRGDTEQVVPITAFSGFYESPEPPSLGDVCGIAPPHCHGYRNGLRWRCSLSLPPPFLPGIIIAKDHVMVHLN